MKLTIVQVGESPAKLRDRYPRYPEHFQRMFAAAGAGFAFETLYVLDGDPFPDPATLEGIVITGSAAGVYESHAWIDPLRAFVRAAYGGKTPMLGVCFGHQIMAEALGGDVRKSEKGWGIGRNEYRVLKTPDWLGPLGDTVAIPASHQDQVIAPPDEAEVFLASDFTPNAGLVYRNGAAVSIQPHPEFDHAFSGALVGIRRGNPLSDAEADQAEKSLQEPLDNIDLARALARFFLGAASGR